MKTKRLSLMIVSLVIFTGFPISYIIAGEVNLTFVEPKKFTDYELTGNTRKKSLKVLERDMKNLFNKVSEEIVPDDYTLTIKVKNIDLPGNIRYGMGRTNNDIRVIDNATFFKLVFDYTLKNSAGEVLKQGEHQLKEFTDSQRQTLPMRNRNTVGYFEKPLKKWMKAALAE